MALKRLRDDATRDMARLTEALRILGVADGTCRMMLDAPDEAAIAEIHRVVAAYR